MCMNIRDQFKISFNLVVEGYNDKVSKAGTIQSPEKGILKSGCDLYASPDDVSPRYFYLTLDTLLDFSQAVKLYVPEQET